MLVVLVIIGILILIDHNFSSVLSR
ncbi:MAG: hypothetical protein L3J55_09600 [Lutibacter sp.]|nr:hypothetical protein [Lutibacter sp.]